MTVPVKDYPDIDSRIEEGTRNRTVAATNMNATSRYVELHWSWTRRRCRYHESVKLFCPATFYQSASTVQSLCCNRGVQVYRGNRNLHILHIAHICYIYGRGSLDVDPSVLFIKKKRRVPYKKLLNFKASLLEPYQGMLTLGRFCTNFVAIGPYCHDFGSFLFSVWP